MRPRSSLRSSANSSRRACGVLIAALALAANEPRAKREYARWSRWDWVGGACCSSGSVIVLNAAVSHVSFAWLVATQHYKDRMLENGLWAVGALAVGVGVFPMIAGLAGLVRPRERWTAEPAFRGVLWSADRRVRLVHGGEGGVHLDDVLDARRRAEPDLRRAAPLRRHRDVLRATRCPRRRPGRCRPRSSRYLLVANPYKMDMRIYSDAPGLSLLAAGNRTYGWTPDHAESVLLWILVAAVAVVGAVVLLRGDAAPRAQSRSPPPSSPSAGTSPAKSMPHAARRRLQTS